MHPDLLRALAKARHEDLLDGRRRQARGRLDGHTPRFARSRRWVGSLLIWVGAGLVGETRPAVELGHEESGLASGLHVRFPS